MRILVTGGSGFIGSNFIEYWLTQNPNDEVVNLDKLTYASDQNNLVELEQDNRYEFVKGDIADVQLMRKIAKDVDLIVNFAAESHVDNSIKNSDEFVNSNIVGVHVILKVVRELGTRFHQVSTDEVYGSLSLNSSEKFSENSKYSPRNPYSATKASADFLVNAFYNTYKVPVTISNCSNNFGPNQHPEKLIPKTILNALKNEKIPLYGNGKQVRDWIYVEDHCSALEAIIKRGTLGKTYLVSSDNERANIDVVLKILKLMGRNEDLIEFVEDRPGHDVRYALDSTLLRKELGWKEKYDFENGLELTVKHYLKYKDRYYGKSKEGYSEQ